jgi:hypothetical protein
MFYLLAVPFFEGMSRYQSEFGRVTLTQLLLLSTLKKYTMCTSRVFIYNKLIQSTHTKSAREVPGIQSRNEFMMQMLYLLELTRYYTCILGIAIEREVKLNCKK